VKALHEQDHYAVLELRMGATADEIDRAYRAMRDTYRSESLALYSLFTDRDAATIRERVEEAYRVLSDPDQRRTYDASSAGQDAASDPRAVAPGGDGGLAGMGANESPSDTFRDLESDIDEEAGEFDGPKLRRARLRRGFELDQIADITKVSVANLARIEDEEFADLPATVYVRGFVTAYSRTIGLDPTRVVASYLARVEQARQVQPHGRFRSRP
jgi:DnaJ-class molecular chaperone